MTLLNICKCSVMNKMVNCPICGMGQLIEHKHKLAFDGANIPNLLHSLCSYCGEYVTTPEQSRHNKTLINEFRQATRAHFSD